MKENKDYIEYFISNEKKQKRITFVTAILFAIFTCIIIYFCIKVSKQDLTITRQGKTIQLNKIQIDSFICQLDSFNKQLVATNNRLKQDSFSQDKSISTFQNNNYASPQNDYLTSAKKVGGIKEGGKFVEPPVITQYQKPGANIQKNYVIYTQYASSSKNAMDLLTKTLSSNKNYKVPESQKITSLNFSSSIRYFNKEDSVEATRIAKAAQSNTGKTYKVQYIELNAPIGQIEVWVN